MVFVSVANSEVDLYYCLRVGHKNVSVIQNSKVSVFQGLLYYWSYSLPPYMSSNATRSPKESQGVLNTWDSP